MHRITNLSIYIFLWPKRHLNVTGPPYTFTGVLGCFLLAICMHHSSFAQTVYNSIPSFSPNHYVVHKTKTSLDIDGNLTEKAWQQASWTKFFIDIEGEGASKPFYQTRAKMLWDDNYFYYAAIIEDPHVWATITERDAVIFMDNNFEIFIDPNGTTHNYYELEINALGTYWDLLLTKPYRNGGRPVDAWDIKGLQIGTQIDGTLNDSSDTDKGWTLEVAIPWDVLMETVHGNRPNNGDQWRLNFSRVQWHTDIEDGSYRKQKAPKTNEQLPEENWSWSSQGLINMHYPEMWGYIQFSDKPAGTDATFKQERTEEYKWLMRVLYYRQIEYRNSHGYFTIQPEQLQYENLFSQLFDNTTHLPELTISVLDNHYIMKLEISDLNQLIYIQNDSKIWTEPK